RSPGELELKGQVLLRVSVVINVDFIHTVSVEREVVRATISILQRKVVRDNCDKVGSTGLVTVKHVEVGPVQFGSGRDEGRFAMARRPTALHQEHARASRKKPPDSSNVFHK